MAEWIVGSLAAFGLIGTLFAVPFLSVGIGKIDLRARGTGLGFRLMVLPGVVAFWPVMLYRWLRRGETN